MDFGGKAEGADCFLKEGGLFALGFGECDCNLGAAEGDRDSREPGAGTEIEQCGDSDRQGASAGDGFYKMTGENPVFIADCGQVGAGIPAEKQNAIDCELSDCHFIEKLQACACQGIVEPRGYRLGVPIHSARPELVLAIGVK